MNKENKKQLIIIVFISALVVAGALGYLQHKKQVNNIMQVRDTSCLLDRETASHESVEGSDFIIIKNKDTNLEIRRFRLPKDMLTLDKIGQCGVDVIVANNYTSEDGYYVLAPGGLLERWQYSYDGKEKKLLTIIDNTNQGSATLKINKFKNFVSVVRGDLLTIEVLNMYTGKKVYETSGLLFNGFNDRTYWRYPDTGPDAGKEIFIIEFEPSSKDRPWLIDTKTWEASSSPSS